MIVQKIYIKDLQNESSIREELRNEKSRTSFCFESFN